MKTYFTAILIFVSSSLFAQKQIKIDYSDNKVAELAKEVYGDVVEYQTAEHIALYKKFLNQIEIVDITNNQAMLNGNYKLISTLSLVSKYNPDLDYDKGPNFDIQKFNPLKYFFDTNEEGATEYYRIYQTNYLIRVLPSKK